MCADRNSLASSYCRTYKACGFHEQDGFGTSHPSIGFRIPIPDLPGKMVATALRWTDTGSRIMGAFVFQY